MRDPDELRELESLGLDDGEQEEEWKEDTCESGGGAPLLQAVLCALALIALVFFKLTDEGRYEEITGWYQSEMAQEIELPQLGPPPAETTPSPQPSQSPAPTPPALESVPPERL